MAKFCNYVILLAFFVATAIAKTSYATTESVLQCSKYIGQECGTLMYDKIFGHNNSKLTNKCCYKLVQTGYPCHTRMTVYALNTPEHKNANLSKVLAKSDDLFDKCDQQTTPGSSLSLAKCIERLSSDCGEEVGKGLTQDKSITKQCCIKVVKTGIDCHINLTKSLIRSPDVRNEDALQVLEKSKKIFNQCKNHK
ncbi:hypothetical protein RIF29_41790 [Crotalaria pallida]|uniref:Prolamin-like domain-containing protein n=1 Tax=Crotalaria pallida TaxID=3830 RepID=A0AAN9E5R6_CROPI